MESREEELEQCLQRLLELPELARPCAETRAAIEDVTEVLHGSGPDELRQTRDSVAYVAEQVESIRLALAGLCREFIRLKKAVWRAERQRLLF